MTSEQIQKKLSALETQLSYAAKAAPEVAKKVAIAALEDVRRFCKDAGMEDIAQMNRTALGAKLLERRRTRFFVAYADHGIRLSALLFLVASHTRRAWKAGKRGQGAGWRNTAEWFGAQIGISGRQIHRLVREGKNLRLLDFLRTRRGLLLWVSRNVHAIPEVDREDEFHVGHYYLRLARLLGINGSILYRFLKVTDDYGDWRRLTGQSAAHRFRWLSQKAASVELHRLFRRGNPAAAGQIRPERQRRLDVLLAATDARGPRQMAFVHKAKLEEPKVTKWQL